MLHIEKKKMKLLVATVAIVLSIINILSANEAIAGFSYDNPYSYDSVITPVYIENVGIYNLVIAVQFLSEPYETKVYKSDEYKVFIRRLSVEWSGLAIERVLISELQDISDLNKLKMSIESKINERALLLRKKYSLSKDVEVVYSISKFYILSPQNR